MRRIHILNQAQCEKAMPAEVIVQAPNVVEVPRMTAADFHRKHGVWPPHVPKDAPDTYVETPFTLDAKAELVSAIIKARRGKDRRAEVIAERKFRSALKTMHSPSLTMRAGRPVIVKRTTKYLNDGMGLLLCVSPSPTDPDGVRRSWIFRWRGGEKVGPRRRLKKIGLGSLLTTDLARARELADRCRRQIADGLDPLTIKRGQAAAAKVQEMQLRTLRAAVEEYVHKHSAGWSRKHALMFKNSFDHIKPILDLPCQALTTPLIVQALSPYWTAHPESARRLRSFLERVISLATSNGWRDETMPNPALWESLRNHFQPRAKLQPVKHMAALPWKDAPAAMERLMGEPGVTARGLELLIRTGVRTNEIRTALAEEFDLVGAIWTVPPEKTKTGKRTGKPHVVPLSTQALACLRQVEMRPGQRVFPIHEHAMKRLMRRITKVGVPHGWRSTLSTWANEQTDFPREIVEAVLDHLVGGDVERRYRRTTWQDKRAALLQQWNDLLSGKSATGENVIEMAGRRA
jgi:integrase